MNKAIKRILIAVGGSGGHVYPAQAVAEGLKNNSPFDIELLFIGGGLTVNPFFDRNTFRFQDVACAPFSSKNPLTLCHNMYAFSHGILQSRRTIQLFTPDIIIGFGSFHSFPPLVAARLAKIPMILHEANAIPGKINRLFARYAHTISIAFPDAAELLEGNTVEVEMPMRTGYRTGIISKEEARKFYGLQPHLSTILIFGGSQGALAINRLCSEAAVICAEKEGMPRFQVLHFTGSNKGNKEAIECYQRGSVKAIVKDFESRMDMAWSAADLVIGRSGASTVAEQIAFEVPGILIPYPYAADGHQDKNADFMALTVKGCFKYQQDQLTSEKVADILYKILDRDHAVLKEMKHAIQRYKNHMERPKVVDVVNKILQSR